MLVIADYIIWKQPLKIICGEVLSQDVDPKLDQLKPKAQKLDVMTVKVTKFPS